MFDFDLKTLSQNISISNCLKIQKLIYYTIYILKIHNQIQNTYIKLSLYVTYSCFRIFNYEMYNFLYFLFSEYEDVRKEDDVEPIRRVGLIFPCMHVSNI